MRIIDAYNFHAKQSLINKITNKTHDCLDLNSVFANERSSSLIYIITNSSEDYFPPVQVYVPVLASLRAFSRTV